VERLTEKLAALAEFAGVAGALLGHAVLDLTESGQVQVRIAKISARLPSGRSSSRSSTSDGRPRRFRGTDPLCRRLGPDLVFADARAIGLEADLEMATLAASIKAAAGLPPGAWLSLNVSPGLTVGNGRLAGLLRTADRPLVLEVTEHVTVADYAALRAAIGLLRPRCASRWMTRDRASRTSATSSSFGPPS